MNKLYLSNSQVNTFADCERKWFHDKQLRLRPNYKGSALLFGSAIDEAVESMLIGPEDEDYEAVFMMNLHKFEINGKAKRIPEDLLDVRFFASDLDARLIVDGYLDRFNATCETLGFEPIDVKAHIEYCKQQRRLKTPLNEDEQTLYNTLGILSLEHKGKLMLPVIKKWIDENVAKVISVQKKIQIENDNGDAFIGYLDFIVELKDGRTVLIDLKTSSSPKTYYPEDSASESRQLGIYAQEEQIYDVAYLVVDKVIRVREPRVRLHYVEGTITEEHLDDVFEDIEDYTEEIKEKLEYGIGAFDKNLDSCHNYGNCEYIDFCKNGSLKGLEYVKK